MQRPIKFRAYQPHNSLHRKPGMYTVTDIVFYPQHGDDEVFLAKGTEKAKSSEYLEDVELMQYTGLKDKNGTDVYESDYYTMPPHDDKSKHYEVKWGHSGFGLPDSQYMEVIGNVYENGDLLK